MKFSPGGSPLTNFAVAVNRGRSGQDDQRTEQTDWFRLVCWNKLAETADQYLKKGSCVYVEGRLQIRKYIANGGAERTAAEIVANGLLMLSTREDGAAANGSKSLLARSVVANPFDDEFDDLGF